MLRPMAKLHPVPVLATKDSTGDYRFQPKSEIWDDSAQQFVFQKDKHGMRKQDYHLIEFALDDQTGDALKFPETPHDAMWVTEGHNDPARRSCPDMHTISNYEVMEPICVTDDRKRLIVRNDNPRKEDWAFTLNFTKTGEDETDRGRYVSWDPGGANQNGGSIG